MYQINDQCYNFKEINFEKGIFDDSIDSTYILHLRGNGRLENVYSQLNNIIPSKKVFILFNKGFKKCQKNKNIRETWKDLIEANYKIFLHAKEHNYNNILILEDDFIFDEEIKKVNNQLNITKFINKKKDKSFIYSIGCLPLISIPLYYDRNTYYAPYFVSMHSCIFSKKYREKILNIGLKEIYEKELGWDVNLNLSCYMYRRPLCYQKVEETENKKTWDNWFINVIIQRLRLDSNPDYGFKIINKLSKLLFWLIIVMILFIILEKYKSFRS